LSVHCSPGAPSANAPGGSPSPRDAAGTAGQHTGDRLPAQSQPSTPLGFTQKKSFTESRIYWESRGAGAASLPSPSPTAQPHGTARWGRAPRAPAKPPAQSTQSTGQGTGTQRPACHHHLIDSPSNRRCI